MIRHHYAAIDGHKIFYREAGSAVAPAIVLLHGFPSSLSHVPGSHSEARRQIPGHRS